MIPTTNSILTSDIEIQTMPSKQHQMSREKERIIGTCDNREALMQAIYKILNTERFGNVIYSWNYGIELSDLYGNDVLIVCSELPNRITDALTQDDRITGVDGFEFDTSKKSEITASFTVHTIYGDINAERVVNI